MHWYFGIEVFAALSFSATGWQYNLNLHYCSISSPLERKEICYEYITKSTRKGEGDAKNVIWFHWPSALLLMEGYANESDSSLSVPLSPCSVLLPGCSSPVASSWWLLDQADLFLYRPGAALFGKTRSRAGCFSTSWLTLLCQPLQLCPIPVGYESWTWWDLKLELKKQICCGDSFMLMLWHPRGKHSFASWYTVVTSNLFAKAFHVTFGQE